MIICSKRKDEALLENIHVETVIRCETPAKEDGAKFTDKRKSQKFGNVRHGPWHLH